MSVSEPGSPAVSSDADSDIPAPSSDENTDGVIHAITSPRLRFRELTLAPNSVDSGGARHGREADTESMVGHVGEEENHSECGTVSSRDRLEDFNDEPWGRIEAWTSGLGEGRAAVELFVLEPDRAEPPEVSDKGKEIIRGEDYVPEEEVEELGKFLAIIQTLARKVKDCEEATAALTDHSSPGIGEAWDDQFAAIEKLKENLPDLGISFRVLHSSSNISRAATALTEVDVEGVTSSRTLAAKLDPQVAWTLLQETCAELVSTDSAIRDTQERLHKAGITDRDAKRESPLLEKNMHQQSRLAEEANLWNSTVPWPLRGATLRQNQVHAIQAWFGGDKTIPTTKFADLVFDSQLEGNLVYHQQKASHFATLVASQKDTLSAGPSNPRDLQAAHERSSWGLETQAALLAGVNSLDHPLSDDERPVLNDAEGRVEHETSKVTAQGKHLRLILPSKRQSSGHASPGMAAFKRQRSSDIPMQVREATDTIKQLMHALEEQTSRHIGHFSQETNASSGQPEFQSAFGHFYSRFQVLGAQVIQMTEMYPLGSTTFPEQAQEYIARTRELGESEQSCREAMTELDPSFLAFEPLRVSAPYYRSVDVDRDGIKTFDDLVSQIEEGRAWGLLQSKCGEISDKLYRDPPAVTDNMCETARVHSSNCVWPLSEKMVTPELAKAIASTLNPKRVPSTREQLLEDIYSGEGDDDQIIATRDLLTDLAFCADEE